MQTIVEYDFKPAVGDFRSEVIEALRQTPKRLPCKYLYDHRGSVLFDKICTLDDYYPTRTEMGLLRDIMPEVNQAIGDARTIIEFGSGGNIKIRILLDGLDDVHTYVPIDISREHLALSSEDLQSDHEDLNVISVCADYTKPFPLPDEIESIPERLVFFPGSTIGNFERGDVTALIQSMKQAAGPHGKLLLGADLIKDLDVLKKAYNDSEGVTADFNMNLLVRINNELGGDFDLDRFHHEGRFNPEAQRMEMHLVSEADQTASINGETFEFKEGETIFTESSHKYTTDGLAEMFEDHGFKREKVWMDDKQWYSIHLFSVAA